MLTLENRIKKLIIDALQLEDISIDDIDTNEPLFGDGLGLDSIDALELGMALHREFGIKISSDSEETRSYFESVATIATLIRMQEKKD